MSETNELKSNRSVKISDRIDCDPRVGRVGKCKARLRRERLRLSSYLWGGLCVVKGISCSPTTPHHRKPRLSKELPGAPRNTLLKAVSASNLNSAPTGGTATQKKPACLIQGIHANMISARLPETARVPPSLPAITVDANKALKTMGLDGRIKGIHLGIRRHFHLVFNHATDEPTRTATLNYVLGRFFFLFFYFF